MEASCSWIISASTALACELALNNAALSSSGGGSDDTSGTSSNQCGTHEEALKQLAVKDARVIELEAKSQEAIDMIILDTELQDQAASRVAELEGQLQRAHDVLASLEPEGVQAVAAVDADTLQRS